MLRWSSGPSGKSSLFLTHKKTTEGAVSAGQGSRDLPTPGASAASRSRPQCLPLCLGLMTGVAGGFKVAGNRSASLRLWDDVVNLSRRCRLLISLAWLTEVPITIKHLGSQPAPWPATSASACPASCPALRLVGVSLAVAVLLPGCHPAQLVPAGLGGTLWHQSRVLPSR